MVNMQNERFSSFRVLLEEGYLSVATNSFAEKKASDGEKETGENQETSCDTVLLDALQRLKKKMIYCRWTI